MTKAERSEAVFKSIEAYFVAHEAEGTDVHEAALAAYEATHFAAYDAAPPRVAPDAILSKV